MAESTTTPAATPATAPAPEALTGMAAVEALLAPFNRGDAPGLVVGIAQRGKLLMRRGFGMASVEHGVANTPGTRMRIGSTTKQMACLAVLLLAEDGKLSIDDPVHEHLPELPRLSEVEPTLRQLMSHTSGWRCHLALSFGSSAMAIMPKGAGMDLLVRQGELNFEPGRRMIYCNGGYHMLTRVIERTSGQSFEQFMAERIFKPLGMVDTESVPSDFAITPRLATLHQALPAEPAGPAGSVARGMAWRRGMFPAEDIAAEGAVVSTIDDMLRWAAHLRSSDKRVGSVASWAQMLAPTVLSGGVVMPYGLGLMRNDHRGVEVLHHAGGVVGGSSQLLTVPAHALDIVILSNGASVAPAALALKFVDALLAEHLGEPVAREPASRHPALLNQSYYAAATGVLVRFGETQGRLGLSWLTSQLMPLRAGAADLSLAGEDCAMTPIRIEAAGLDGDTAPAFIMLAEGDALHRFEHLAGAAPSAADLAPELVGRYLVPDMDASARIDHGGDGLLLRIQGPLGAHTLRLAPVSADALTAVSTDPLLAVEAVGGVISIEREAGRVTGLRLNEARTRRLRFIPERAA